MWDTYVFASSVYDALDKLAALGPSARVIAGGTDLVLQAQRGECPARAMVDITRVPGLSGVREMEGYVTIGATVTHAQIASSPLIRAKAPLLADACGCIGGPQIRNVATLVGNVVNALPAADGAVALFALDAEAQVTTLDTQVWVPIADLYAGVGECTLDPCVQIVTALRFRPLAPSAGCSFQRLARRRALVLPIVNAAVVIDLQARVVAGARIAVGPVAPTPFRAAAAERVLVGATIDGAPIGKAARLAAQDAHPRSSILRGSSAYRTAMVEVLVRRALQRALGLAS
ncbi:MAG: FAD binding domain-containing protein [Anaerolineae bacterium]|nr:FAD binding domain-containing protein [Anaerolineae bacterium]